MTTVESTIPYPWPYDSSLEPTGVAVVVCGAQQLITTMCAASIGVDDVVTSVTDAVRDAGGIVIWVRHGAPPSRRGRPTWLPARDSAGWELAAVPSAADHVVDSAGWDGCFGSGLDHILRGSGCTTVVLAGYASEITVDSTVRTLNDRGYECLVLTDGCAPLDPQLGSRAHASLTMSGGIFGALGTSSALLRALPVLERLSP